MKTSQSRLVSLVIVGGLALMGMTLAGVAPIVWLWRMNTPELKVDSLVSRFKVPDSKRFGLEAFSSFDTATRMCFSPTSSTGTE